MTPFEEFAEELGVKITTDEDGFYTGHCAVLARMVTEISFMEIDKGLPDDWERTKKKVENEFFKFFPYMKYKVVIS